MRKQVACLLLIGLLFLFGCGKEPAAPVETQAPTTQPKVQTNVAQPLTWEDVSAIPVAEDSMTEEQLRQICLDFMRMQLTVCYTPNDARSFKNGSQEKWLSYGTVYAGLPYVSNCKGNIYKLMEFYDSDNGMLDISAVIYCERKSHKGIIIGKNGAMLKKIGAVARGELEDMLDTRIFLQLWVKVKEDWRNNPALVRNFGYEEE